MLRSLLPLLGPWPLLKPRHTFLFHFLPPEFRYEVLEVVLKLFALLLIKVFSSRLCFLLEQAHNDLLAHLRHCFFLLFLDHLLLWQSRLLLLESSSEWLTWPAIAERELAPPQNTSRRCRRHLLLLLDYRLLLGHLFRRLRNDLRYLCLHLNFHLVLNLRRWLLLLLLFQDPGVNVVQVAYRLNPRNKL